MRDDELLAIYTGTRQIAEAMAARDAELKKSTATLEATIAQARQLPAMLGQQTSKYIAQGLKESLEGERTEPIKTALQQPLYQLELATRQATKVVSEFDGASRFVTWGWFAVILALGFGLGTVGTYFFFTREVGKLRDQVTAMQQAAPTVAPVAAPGPPSPQQQTRKKHGQH